MTQSKKESAVVVIGRSPSGVGGMALIADRRELQSDVVRIGGCVIIVLVA